MSEDKNIIDDIFRQKMSDYEPSETLAEDSWNAIHQKTNQKLFYTFRIKHFNIYYLVGLLASLILLIIFFLPSKNATPSKIEKSNANNIASDSNQTKPSSTTKKSSVTKEETKSTNTSVNLSEIKSKTVVSKVVVPSNSIKNKISVSKQDSLLHKETTKPLLKDSSFINKPVNTKPEIKPETIAPPKVVYMYKRDTVYTYDTVSVKKKKNKNK